MKKVRFTCRKGSLMPDTSCSGEYPDIIRFFRILTNCGTSYKKQKREEVSQYFVKLSEIWFFKSLMCVTLLLMFEVKDFSVKAASSYAMQRGWDSCLLMQSNMVKTCMTNWDCEIKNLTVQMYWVRTSGFERKRNSAYTLLWFWAWLSKE